LRANINQWSSKEEEEEEDAEDEDEVDEVEVEEAEEEAEEEGDGDDEDKEEDEEEEEEEEVDDEDDEEELEEEIDEEVEEEDTEAVAKVNCDSCFACVVRGARRVAAAVVKAKLSFFWSEAVIAGVGGIKLRERIRRSVRCEAVCKRRSSRSFTVTRA
jgi:hypothetical protein